MNEGVISGGSLYQSEDGRRATFFLFFCNTYVFYRASLRSFFYENGKSSELIKFIFSQTNRMVEFVALHGNVQTKCKFMSACLGYRLWAARWSGADWLRRRKFVGDFRLHNLFKCKAMLTWVKEGKWCKIKQRELEFLELLSDLAFRFSLMVWTVNGYSLFFEDLCWGY